MMSRTLALTSVALCAMGLFAPRALAQSPSPATDDASATSARSQYNAGTKAFSEQRYAEAALAFEAAAAEKPSPVALFTAALSWDRTSAPDRAADDYARALALPGLPPDKTTQAKDRLAQLESMLGAVAVTGPDGVRVQLDSNSERPVPATLHGSVGVHSLAVRSAGGAIDQRRVVLERGKVVPLDLGPLPPPDATKPPPAPAPEPAPPPPAASDWKKPVGFVAVGTGGAMLLAGVVFGLEADGARNAYNAAPAQASYDHASQMQMWTDVAFIAGGVLAGAGIALLVWPQPKHAEAPPSAPSAIIIRPTLGGASVVGTF
jgi:hypothetical protein